MITTAISINRGIALGASGDAATCRVRTAAPVATPARIALHDAQHMSQGQVWFRPATLDVLVPTTPGHLAWSPPT